MENNFIMRSSGILLPVSALPGKYGIGSFSKEAYAFVDFLESAGQRLWQILPLGQTSYGDSPYQSFSTFAGNPYFISLETLIEELNQTLARTINTSATTFLVLAVIFLLEKKELAKITLSEDIMEQTRQRNQIRDMVIEIARAEIIHQEH